MKAIFFISLIVLFSSGCKREVDPEVFLINAIEQLIETKQSKEYLLSISTGELLEHIKNSPTEEIEKYLDLSNYKKRKVKINHKECINDKCSINYSLAFDIKSPQGMVNTEAEVRKLAELVRIDGGWKLSDITNIKTFYNSKEALSP